MWGWGDDECSAEDIGGNLLGGCACSRCRVEAEALGPKNLGMPHQDPDVLIPNKALSSDILRNVGTNMLLAELRRRDIYDDVRVRSVTRDGRYRVVAPQARRADGTVYHNGILIIGEQHKDSLGYPIWQQLGDQLITGNAYSKSNPPLQRDVAMFHLLADCDK